MKKSRYIILCAMVVLTIVSCEKELRPGGVVINDPIRHYFPVIQGVPLTLTYEMEDTTDNPIFIQEVQTSCGCVVPNTILPLTILPHKKAFLTLTFNTFKNTGYVHHYIYCYGNFEDTSTIILEFDTNIVPSADYIHDYEEIWYEHVRNGDIIKRSVDGETAQKGYYTDEYEAPRTRRTERVQQEIDEKAP